MEVHGQVILSFFFGFCCFVSFPPSSFRTFDIFGDLFSGVLKIWTCSIKDTNERYIESFTQRRSANFFSYLSIIQSVSRKLWSEAAWFRFSTHLYFAIASIYWISICICYLLKHLSIHVRFVLSKELNKRVSETPSKQTFIFFSTLVSRLIRIFVSIMDINVIIRSCDVQSTESRNTNNQSSKGNSEDKSIRWTKPM